jgi:hypothetical protein
MTVAHIAGVPVEETAGTLLPFASAVLIGLTGLLRSKHRTHRRQVQARSEAERR